MITEFSNHMHLPWKSYKIRKRINQRKRGKLASQTTDNSAGVTDINASRSLQKIQIRIFALNMGKLES